MKLTGSIFSNERTEHPLLREVLCALKRSEEYSKLWSFLREWDPEATKLPILPNDGGFVFSVLSLSEEGNAVYCRIKHGFPEQLCGGVDTFRFTRVGETLQYVETLEEIVY